RLLVLIN
ncbi:his Kinase A domain protein, partial [Vibrio parahaemolyticus V-223/04]